MAQCLRDISYAREFTQIFTNRFSHIIGIDAGLGYQTLSMQAELYERYLVRMLIDINLNEDRTQLLGHGNPRWVVYEIRVINKLPDGTFEITPHSDSERKLTKEQWQKVVATGGDLSVLGLSVVKDKPVRWFKEYWRSNDPGMPMPK